MLSAVQKVPDMEEVIPMCLWLWHFTCQMRVAHVSSGTGALNPTSRRSLRKRALLSVQSVSPGTLAFPQPRTSVPNPVSVVSLAFPIGPELLKNFVEQNWVAQSCTAQPFPETLPSQRSARLLCWGFCRCCNFLSRQGWSSALAPQQLEAC